MYHGRPFNPIHAAPFVYPRGWAYRRWVVGATLPPLFYWPCHSRVSNGFVTDRTYSGSM